jgi:hypothetical protein
MILFERESTSSTAANRLSYAYQGIPLILMPGDSIAFRYNTTTSRWEFLWGSRHGNANAFFDVFSELHVNGPFTSFTSGTGATSLISAYLANDATQKTFGVSDCTTGTTSTGRCYVGTSASGMFGGVGCALSVGRAAPQTLSNGTETYKAYVGFNDASAAASLVDGCCWEYDQATTTDWRTVTSSNSTATKNTVTGLTVSVSVMHYLGVFCNGDWTNIEFFYSSDGDIWNFTTSTHTTNIPTGTSRLLGVSGGITKFAGTTSRSFSLDYLGYRSTFKRGV